ncbi:hypothetical protein J5X84_06740 [Streptosporangiaceae bacterium NEAU-GS5]|nr:hypothetical protein [Streptosporangiaceae bacterium NEAU-GS5]
MKKLLLLVPLIALIALPSPARADVPETDAQLAAEWQLAWDFYKFYQVLTNPLPITGRATRSQDISVDINSPRQHVFDAYSNFDNHIGRAAFLVRNVYHQVTVANGVRTNNLTAIEDIPLPIVGIVTSDKTHAQQRIHLNEYYYETDSWTLPNVVTHQKIVFDDLGGGVTRVTEHLTFEASIALIDYTVTNGVSSHQQTQAGLKAAIESGVL